MLENFETHISKCGIPNLLIQKLNILACILCAIICIFFCTGCNSNDNGSSTYVFPPDLCIAMFHGEPQDLAYPKDIFMEFANFDVCGGVDEAENFVFTLTAEQKKEIRENCLAVIEQMRGLGATISEDYTVFLVEVDTYKSDSLFVCGVHNACLFLQLVEQGDPSKVFLEWHVYDPENEDIFIHTFWPEHYDQTDMIW